MESAMLSDLVRGESVSDGDLASYGRHLTGYSDIQKRYLSLYSEDKRSLFSTLPSSLGEGEIAGMLDKEGSHYYIRDTQQGVFMLLCSYLDMQNRGTYLLSVYDITSIFHERDRQLRFFLLLDISILLTSVVTIFVVSLFLTAPIKKLSQASRKIAQGAYHERTVIRSGGEIGQLSRSFNQMAEAVEERVRQLNLAVEQRDDFIAGFSHEMKTPMTTILGYADLLRCVDCDPQMRQKAAGYIYRESKRLEDLSQKMMDLMSLTQEHIELSLQPVQALLHRFKDIIVPELGDLQMDVQAQKGTVYTDEALFFCMLRNLVMNAKKAGPKDGTIHIRGKQMGDRYRLYVIDTGCGISEENLPRITEPFYMVDKARTRANGGAGIGLSICDKIARLHGGSLHFTSRLDVGTSVWFEMEVEHEELGEQCMRSDRNVAADSGDDPGAGTGVPAAGQETVHVDACPAEADRHADAGSRKHLPSTCDPQDV